MLTLLFRKTNLMLIMLMRDGKAATVVEQFDYLTSLVGVESFRKIFPVILTDNGSEFKYTQELEKTDQGEQRTRLFYCDPQASWQKAQLEKNHEYIRYVLRKGKSFNPYKQEDRISTRNRTLYMYCDEKGGVKKYTGKVEDVDESETKGHASLRDIDPVGKVHFNTKNIDPSAPKLKKGTILQKLEIGFGYIGTTLYTEDGRKGWGDNVE